jgi:hypothetical protein
MICRNLHTFVAVRTLVLAALFAIGLVASAVLFFIVASESPQ